MDLELAGKVALVTGSSRGLGFAIARGLRREGAEVVLNGRDATALTQAQRSFDGVALALTADVTDPAQCVELIQAVEERHGRLDVLVCNVGSGHSLPPGTETAQEWERMLRINLQSATNMVEAAREALARSRGAVVCISSICGLEALGAPVAYSAAKAALNAYVRSSARPLAAFGVRINAVAPGNLLFPGSTWERKLAENAQAVQAMLEREVAQRRLGSAEEIADFVAFLASPRAAFATGTVLVVDGGQVRS
jgi:3-oxoacyl-[acyl-carrier protein] reductase